MELEVPTPITYSSTHAQLNLPSVNDGPQSPKGIATSVSMPAFILYPGSISTSITISVTDPHGDTVDYKPGAGSGVGDEDEEGDYDDDYAPVPALGYFSSCSSVDSLATLASHEDLAAFVITPATFTAAAAAAAPAPVPAVEVDGLDIVGAPQQAQQMQHFLRFQQTQQARYAGLFDEAYGADGGDEFDFFGYGRNLRESVEIEIEDAETAIVEDDTTDAKGWAAPEEEAEDAPHGGPFLVPFLVPVLDVPVSHERDHLKDAKANDSVAEADKENHNPVEAAVNDVGVDAPEQVIVAVVKDVVKDAKNVELSALDTLDVLHFTSAASILTSTSTHDLNIAPSFTLDGALDFGFDFGGVLDDVVRRVGGVPPTSIDVTIPTSPATPVITPNPALALSKFADESPYSSPSVYSTASAPYSPYPFATPLPDQQSEVQVPKYAIAEASSSTYRALAGSVPTATAGVFDVYDPTCFDGLGFESMDLRLCADGSVQVVFDAGEDEDESEDEAKVDAEEANDRKEKQERGDDSFSHLEVGQEKQEAEIQCDTHVVCETTTKMTEAEEAFEKWRQACIALATFAHIPLKAEMVSSTKWHDRRKGEKRAKNDVFMVGLATTIEVFGVTVSEVTVVVAATEAMEASEGKDTDPSGSESALDDAAGASTAFTSQPKIEPAPLPCALRGSGVPEPATSLTAINEPEEEATFERDEAHDVSPPPEDIVSYIYSIPGPECMPSFAAVIAEHLSPAPTPAITPASSFAIPVASSLDDCPLLSEPAPAPMQSSSFASLQTLTESQSVDMPAERSMSIDDVDNMPSLMAEESPFNALADLSASSSSMSSFCEDDMVFPDDMDVLAAAEMETGSESLHAEREFLIEVGSPTADLSNVPLDTIQEEPEDEMDPECAELLKSLAELEPDYESDDETDYDAVSSIASASFSIVIAPSPLLTVYEELSGGPQHLFNSIPRYAIRSLDSLSHPWLSSISSLSSLGGRSSVAHVQKDSGQMARGSEVTSSDSPSLSSSAAPAAASEDDGWSLVASPRPAPLSSLETPRRPATGLPSAVTTPSSTSSPGIQKKHRFGFFMSRMTFCPSPSPKRTGGPSPMSSTLRPRVPASVPSLTPAPVERTEATGTQARSGGRIRSMLRKLRTLF